MRLLFLIPAMLLPAASAAAPADDEAPAIIHGTPFTDRAGGMPLIDPGGGSRSADNCPPTSRYHAARGRSTPNAKNLNELPAADMYKAVYRRIGGCEVPIIAGYNVGGR